MFDVVFHFGLLLTQTSLGSPLDGWATKKTVQKRPLLQPMFFFFQKQCFLLYNRSKGKRNSCLVIVVYLQGIIV